MRRLNTLVLVVGLNSAYATDASASGSDESGNVNAPTIDGDDKKLHRGIFVKFRTNVLIQDLKKVQHTNFNGIWLGEVNDSRMMDVQIRDCDAYYYASKLGNTYLIGNRKNCTIN